MRTRRTTLLLATVAASSFSLLAQPLTTLAQERGGNAAPPPPTPRLADGTPNLGRVPGEVGVWRVAWIGNIADRIVSVGGVPVKREAVAAPADALSAVGDRERRGGARSEPHVPFMPWSAAVYDYHSKNASKYDPEGYCLPPGGPRMMATPYPMEIIQLPEQKRILMIFEGATHIWREIYLDGRGHPQGDALNPTYLGHSIGHWERDTLVVDTVGFNEGTWLDYFGHPHTDLLHVIERFTRPNKNTLHFEATIDDPGAYTKPFTAAWDVQWDAKDELKEYICQENNQFLLRLTDDFGEPIFRRKP